jgi:ribonuclease Z
MIDVLLLGTGAMVPLPDRYLSSALFRVGGSLNLIDCGEGTQMSWRRFHWGFKRLDTIFLTHHHADHVAGLPGLFHTVANAGRTEPMHLYGPPGIFDVIKGLRVIAPHLPYDMFVHEVTGGDTFELPNGVRGRVAYGDHRGPVLAYRFEYPREPAFLPDQATALGVPQRIWGHLTRGEDVEVEGRVVRPADVLGEPRKGISFAFVTDTRPTEELVEIARDVDLLICEGTYGDDADHRKAVEKRHMTFREAATIARDAGAGALWLTHFGQALKDPGAWAHNARDVFSRSQVGFEGLSGQITFEDGYRDGESPGWRSPDSMDST